MKISELRRSFKLEDNEIVQNRVYTQLAKEGKFDELPETCAFSDPVIMEVWDDERLIKQEKVYGKFMGDFITKMSSQNVGLYCWQNARLPLQKIDFSEFKAGDVVELELVHNETRIGWFDYVDNNNVVINILKRKGNQVCNGGSCAGTKIINKEKIKSITKIK